MPERPWLFASDLHGSLPRYERLFAEIRERRPEAVLLGGDLLPSALFLMSRSAHSIRFLPSGARPGSLMSYFMSCSL